MVVDAVYDGTDFEMQTPVANPSTVDVNGQTAITNPGPTDSFLEYNASALGNRKILFSDLKGAISKRGGDGSDGALN